MKKNRSTLKIFKKRPLSTSCGRKSDFTFLFHENTFDWYDITPLQIVAFEDLLGLILWSLIIPILGLTPCPFGIDPCTFDSEGSAYLERADIFLAEFWSNELILAFTFCYILAIPIFNLALGQVINRAEPSLWCSFTFLRTLWFERWECASLMPFQGIRSSSWSRWVSSKTGSS